jgi:predicted nuclease of predicted toxin-antitoxin system
VKPRFQADADVRIGIVEGLIKLDPQVDFQAADDLGIRGRNDPKVLALAAETNRILVTHDRRTMPFHFAAFLQNDPSPGVIVIAQNVSIRTAIAELYKIWLDDEHADYVNRIVDIPF